MLRYLNKSQHVLRYYNKTISGKGPRGSIADHWRFREGTELVGRVNAEQQTTIEGLFYFKI